MVTNAGEACAEWWADKIFGGVAGNNGDGLSSTMAIVAGAQGSEAKGDRERFVDILAERINQILERMSSHDSDYEALMSLGVDYGPDPILFESAQNAGLSAVTFPWKTYTYVRPSHVTASLGYGAPTTLIWNAEDWVRPSCGCGKYSDAGDREPWKCSLELYHEQREHVFDDPEPLCTRVVELSHQDSSIVCNRPQNADWHQSDDDYRSAFYHEFITS